MTLVSVIILVVTAGLITTMAVMLFRIRKVPPKPFVYSRWQDIPVWLRVVVVITALNFFAFFSVAETHGGTAWNGYRRNGHYFLGEGRDYTEVSRTFWLYSYYHALSVSLSYAAMFIGAAVATTRKSSSEL